MKSVESERAPIVDTADSYPLRKITGMAGIRLGAMGLAFVTNILLARVLGVGEFGVFVYVLTWVGLLTVVATLGLDRLLVREVASYHLKSSWGLLRGLVRWTYAAAVTTSMCIAVLLIVVGCGYETFLGNAGDLTAWAGAGLLICIVATRLIGATIQGLHQVIRSQLAEAILQPGLCLVVVVVIGIVGRNSIAAGHVMALYVGAAFFACIFSAWQLRRSIPPEARRTSVPAQYECKRWFFGAVPLLSVSILTILNSQISQLILGGLSGTVSLGMYAAADRGAQLVVFPLAVANLTLAPTYANLYQSHRHDDLQQLVTRTVRLVVAASTPIAVALVLGGHWFLLFFGDGFTGGRTALTILCVGQLASAAFGPVGYLLIMTGYGREAAVGLGCGVVTSVALAALLVGHWGATGAAVATSTGLVVWNVVLALFVWKRLGISTTAFGRGERSLG